MNGEPWDDWGVEREPGLTRDELAARVARATDGFVSAVEAMPPDTLDRPGAIGIWSGRECIAHCVVWHEYAEAVLRTSLDGTFRSEDFAYGDEDEFNERTARELAVLSTDDLLERLRASSRTTAELLMRLPEKEWDASDRYHVVVQGELVEHLDEHLGDLRGVGGGG